MPASVSRHRLAAPLVGAVLALGLLAGCTGQSTPDGYTDSVERNFIRGCTETSRTDGIDDPDDYCRCAFDAIEENVEWGRFKEIREDQIDEPGVLPEEFQEHFAGCRGSA